MTPSIIALCNQKGGVGKTTTAVHLARAAVVRGWQVLLVDADPQGNATTVAAADDLPADAPGLADALSDRTPDTLADVLVPGVWEGLTVAPTVGGALGVVRNELAATAVGREQRLAAALGPVREAYDLILIDCAPSLDQLTINALTAADKAVAITEAKLFGSHGLVQLLDTIRAVQSYYNPRLHLAAVIINRYQAQTNSARAWRADLDANSAAHGLPILDPPMPLRVAISDAAEASQGLDQWPSRDARQAFDLYSQYLTTITKE